jgi:hypothetical protein
MNRIHLRLLFLVATAALAFTTGCSSGTSGNPNPPANISVSFASQPASSIQVGNTTSLTANVSNDSANGGVKWSVACGSSACGTFSTATTASGSATTYTAPFQVPSANTVTLTATAASDSTKSVSATITVTSAPAISVALTTPAPSSMLIGTIANITAAVGNDPTNAGVKWSVTCGSSSCGGFNPAATGSGSATTYTAPATAPTGNSVTVTATSVTDPTKYVNATITITTPTPSILADGTYIYNLSGQDSVGTYYVAGAFAIKNGVIISGEQDFVDPNGSSNDQLVASGSNINTTTGNIQVTLATANTSIGVNGIETLRGTLVSNTRMLVTQFDDFASATGSIDLQTNTSPLLGGYAFMLNGDDNNTGANQLAIGGVLNFNSGALVTAGSIFDFNDSGTIGKAQTYSSGTASAPDAYGRVNITLAPSNSSLPTLMFAGYTVGSRTYLVENAADNYGGVLGGVALSQGGNTGKFSQINVAGQSYATGLFGQDQNGYLGIGGGFGLNSDGTVTGAAVFNDLNINNGNSLNGTYTVDATGRVTLSNVAFSNVSGATFGFQLYLDGNGNAVAIGVDQYETSAGLGYLQNASGADYEGNFALSAQGILNQPGAPASGAVGPVTISSDSISGFTDNNSQGYGPSSDVQLTGSEDSATGLFHLTGLNAQSFSGISSGYGYYPIDATHVLGATVSDDQISIVMLEGIAVSVPAAK